MDLRSRVPRDLFGSRRISAVARGDQSPFRKPRTVCAVEEHRIEAGLALDDVIVIAGIVSPIAGNKIQRGGRHLKPAGKRSGDVACPICGTVMQNLVEATW